MAFTCKDPKKLRAEIIELVQSRGLNLVSIRQEEKNLESVFQSLTQN